MSNTILITSGCSFTETRIEKTWPVWLTKRLATKETIHTGLSCQGNGMISRKVIHAVHEALKTESAKDIIVGITWSGPSRHEQYTTDKSKFPTKNINGWIDNPTTFVKDDPGGWVIYNSYWDIPQAIHYYRHTYDETYSQIQTLEHIIRTQNYFKLHKIKYFMNTYMNEVFAVKDKACDHLYEQIDYNQFLQKEGMMEWSKKTGLASHSDTLHPSADQHELFVDQVIMPFLNRQDN
jgi:hypothetical protein